MCPPPGPGQMSSYRPVQSSQDLPSDHKKQLREGNVRQGQSEAGARQGRPPEHEWTRERQQRGESICWTLTHTVFSDPSLVTSLLDPQIAESIP